MLFTRTRALSNLRLPAGKSHHKVPYITDRSPQAVRHLSPVPDFALLAPLEEPNRGMPFPGNAVLSTRCCAVSLGRFHLLSNRAAPKPSL